MTGRSRSRSSAAAFGLLVLIAAAVVLAAAAAVLVPWWDRGADLRLPAPSASAQAGAGAALAAVAAADSAAVARGAYLAQVGHCAGCHTDRGGPPYAGGRVLATPFGGVVAANLTPDVDTGLGRWSSAAFRRALRDGRSADGRALLPVCPYPNFSLVSSADADDLLAYLRSLPPQRNAVPDHRLRWPYALPAARSAWRALHFRPARLPDPPPEARVDWARGAYLVGGLAHCSACHGRRNAWGATGGAWDFRGGPMPAQGWLAPSLTDPAQAAVSTWNEAEVVALLRDGRNDRATVSGPMALVVAHSLQHLHEADARAMAEYLRRLPSTPQAVPAARPPPDAAQQRAGLQLYDQHCADCHGKAGEGVADAGPPLAGNRALALASPVNVMRVVLGGGFGPATAAVPRPPGMPPFATTLSDEQLADVVNHVRWRFGGQAVPVTAIDINRQR